MQCIQVPTSLEEMFSSIGMFPNLQILVKILLTHPVTSVEAERSFSSLRRLFVWLRTTMSGQRLNGLGRMHMHPLRLFKIKNSKIIEDFVNCGNRRLEFGGSICHFYYFYTSTASLKNALIFHWHNFHLQKSKVLMRLMLCPFLRAKCRLITTKL